MGSFLFRRDTEATAWPFAPWGGESCRERRSKARKSRVSMNAERPTVARSSDFYLHPAVTFDVRGASAGVFPAGHSRATRDSAKVSPNQIGSKSAMKRKLSWAGPGMSLAARPAAESTVAEAAM